MFFGVFKRCFGCFLWFLDVFFWFLKGVLDVF